MSFFRKLFGGKSEVDKIQRGNIAKTISDTSPEPIVGHNLNQQGICTDCGFTESAIRRFRYVCSKSATPSQIVPNVEKIQSGKQSSPDVGSTSHPAPTTKKEGVLSNRTCTLIAQPVQLKGGGGKWHCSKGLDCSQQMFDFAMAGAPNKICKYSVTGLSMADLNKRIVLFDYTVESEARQSGKCDRCSAMIPNGEGYLVYSDAQSMGIVTGAMMICENCADAFFRKEIWDKARHAAIEVDASDDATLKKAYIQANDISVIMRTKRIGLNYDQARAEAREIAKLWWKDKEGAIQRLLSQ